MLQDAPEQLLRHGGIANFVGVGKAVAAGRSRSPDPGQPAGMVPERVADVVQSDRVGQLAVQHGYDVAPRTEGPGPVFDAMLAGQFLDHMAGDEIAKLGQNAEFAPGWSWS